MKITLEKINLNDKNILTDLLQLYPHEIVDLDKYFENDNYFPYFVKMKDEVVGFVLANIEDDNSCCNLSAIFIKNEYRRQGIGKKAMFQLFKYFVGKWAIQPITNPESVILFFENVIREYTKKAYMKITAKGVDDILFILNTDKRIINKYLKDLERLMPTTENQQAKITG